MAITNGTQSICHVISAFVIIGFLIFPVITAQVMSPTPSDSAVDAENISEPITQQDDNTVRVDPLDNFKKYRGGFNITNKHYWSSVVFTGVPGYAIGALCLVCGILYGSFLVTTRFCCKSERRKKTKKSFPCSYKNCELWPILLAILLTTLVLAATGLVLAGSAKFHSEAGAVVKIIIRTANEASKTIYNTTGALKDINNLMESSGSVEASEMLYSTSEKLDAASANIENQARKNRRLIDKGLEVVFVVTTLTICLNLVAVSFLSVFGVLRFRRALYLLIVLCWLMTVLCWVFFGVYIFLEKFSDDVCTAFDSFQENPYNNSLSSILPCGELLSAKSILSDVSANIYNLVNLVNANISDQQATRYPRFVHICNPFSAPPDYIYQPENCPADTIRIGDIPKELKYFTCSELNDESCNGESIPDSTYKTVQAYTSSIQDLLNSYPSMKSLVECQSVKDAFSDIVFEHCKPLKKFAKMVWAGIVVLAVIMVFLVLLWATKACHEQSYHVPDGSVKPDSTKANTLELGAIKEIDLFKKNITCTI